MDSRALVEGDVGGMLRFAQAFRSRGFDVIGVYLDWSISPDGDERWTLRVIVAKRTPDLLKDMITELVSLRRAGELPRIDSRVRFDILPADDPDAARIIDYTQRLGGAPAVLRDVMTQGLFIEYAVVALAPERDAAAA